MVSAACAASPFDRHYDAHRWPEATRAFEADSSLHDHPDAVYRAALLYATPGSETFQPARARQLFERLLTLGPGLARQEAAIGMIRLLDEVESVRAANDRRERQLRAELEAAEREAADLRQRIVSLESRFRQQEEQNERLRQVAAQLAADLRDRERRMEALGEELDRLKQIDLRPTPRPDGQARMHDERTP